MYEYKMVQVPPTISVGTENKGDEAAITAIKMAALKKELES